MGQKAMKSPRNFRTTWLPAFLFAAFVIIFYKTVDRLPDVFGGLLRFVSILSPFVTGLVIAFLLYIPASKLEGLFKKSKEKFFSNHARGFSVLITYLVALVGIGLALYFVIPKLVESLIELANNVPNYYQSVMNYIDSYAGPDGKIFGFDISSMKNQMTVTNILSYFDVSTLTRYAQGIFKLGSAVVSFMLALVISIYMLLGREHLVRVVGKVMSLFIRKKLLWSIYGYAVRTCEIFYGYIYSQLLDALVVSIILMIVLSVVGVPYAFLLAIIMGLCNIIPYFGALIGGVAVVFITFVSTGNPVTTLIALGCVVGTQQIDANLIQPKIVSNSLGIRPIYVLLAITIGGGLFGFVGVLVGVPILAVIRMMIIDFMERKESDKTAQQSVCGNSKT